MISTISSPKLPHRNSRLRMKSPAAAAVIQELAAQFPSAKTTPPPAIIAPSTTKPKSSKLELDQQLISEMEDDGGLLELDGPNSETDQEAQSANPLATEQPEPNFFFHIHSVLLSSLSTLAKRNPTSTFSRFFARLGSKRGGSVSSSSGNRRPALRPDTFTPPTPPLATPGTPIPTPPTTRRRPRSVSFESIPATMPTYYPYLPPSPSSPSTAPNKPLPPLPPRALVHTRSEASISSPAKRRRLSTTSKASDFGASEDEEFAISSIPVSVSNPTILPTTKGKAATLNAGEAKVITQRKNYTCDAEIVAKEERKKNNGSKAANIPQVGSRSRIPVGGATSASGKTFGSVARRAPSNPALDTSSASNRDRSDSNSSEYSALTSSSNRSRSGSSATDQGYASSDSMAVDPSILAAAMSTPIPDMMDTFDSTVPSVNDGQLVLATMTDMTEWFVMSPSITAAELDAFFVAYSHFKLNPQQLIAKLSELYRKPPSTVIGTSIQTTAQEVKAHVTSFFSKWLANPLQTDFVNGTDAGILDSYVKFVEALRSDGVDIDSLITLPDTMQKKIKARRSSGGNTSLMRATVKSRSAVPAGVPVVNKVDVTKVNSQELALQLTAFESAQFRAIQSAELRGQAWNKSDKDQKAPHISAVINHFNKISFWVATEIVTAEGGIKEQIRVVKKFIKLASILREVGNMNGVMEVVSGLNSLPVQRLKHVWKLVPSKYLAVVRKLEEVMAPNQNFVRYRTELRAKMGSKIPVVPYIGVHLGDIVHVVEGFQDIGDGRIEVAKLVKLGEILVDFRKLQLQEGSLGEDLQYTQYFNSIKPMGPDHLERLVEAQREQAAQPQQ